MDYEKFESLANRLIGGSQQGRVRLVRRETVAQAEDWEEPVMGDPIYTDLPSTSRPIEERLLQEESYAVSDVQLTMAGRHGGLVRVGDEILLDGVSHRVQGVERIPAVGVPVSVNVIVRGPPSDR